MEKKQKEDRAGKKGGEKRKKENPRHQLTTGNGGKGRKLCVVKRAVKRACRLFLGPATRPGRRSPEEKKKIFC